MYNLISAMGVKEGINQRWQSVAAVGQLIAKQALNEWRIIYFKCNNESEGTVVIHSDALRAQYADSAKTLTEVFFQSTQAFPTTTAPPTLNHKTAKYSDCIRSHYHLEPYDKTYGFNLPVQALNDALMTRVSPLTDYTFYHKRCLTTVNGFLHMTDTDGTTGTIVLGATKTKRICNQNSVGIFSFESVCEVKRIPITVSMIKPVMGDNENLPLYDALYLTVPQSTVGKTVGLSLGGYFTLLEPQLYTVVNANTIKLTLNVGNLFIDRLYESRKYIDLSSLNLEVDPRNGSFLEVSKITSNDAVKAYMTLSQSFIILFDHSSLYKTKSMVRAIQMPNKVISYKEPKTPLIGGLGRMPEYWSVHEDGQWAMSFADRDLAHMLYNTTSQDSYVTVTDSQQSISRSRLASTYMLEVGKDI